MTSPSALPGTESVGQTGNWEITDQYGNRITITGELLGLGSSHRPYHRNHPDSEFAPRKVHCSACRWTEIRIFASDVAGARYVVVNRGASAVSGEKDFITFELVEQSPHEVMEILTTRRGGREPFLTAPASRAMSQAAEYDEGMQHAWLNRAVK